MAAREIRAGRAVIEVAMKDKGVKGQLEKLSKRLSAFGASVGKIGAAFAASGVAILAPLTAAASKFAAAGDEIEKMAARTGVAAEALGGLGFAAQQGGASLSDVETGIKGMQRQLFMLKKGSSEAADAFGALGLKLSDLEGKSPEDQFKLIADRVSKIEDPSMRAATAMKVFGDSGSKLLPMMANGAKGLEEMHARAADLGIILSTEDAAAAAKLTDALGEMKNVIHGTMLQIGAAISGPLTEVITKFVDWAKEAVTFVKVNREIIQVIAGVGVGLVGVGTALGTVAIALTGAGIAAGGLATALGLILSPVGAVAFAVAGAGTAVTIATAAFLEFTDAGKRLKQSLADAFGKAAQNTLKDFQSAFEGVSDAIAGGELGLAFDIVFETAKLAIHRGTLAVIETLEKSGDDIRDAMIDMMPMPPRVLARMVVDSGVHDGESAMLAGAKVGANAQIKASQKEIARLKKEAAAAAEAKAKERAAQKEKAETAQQEQAGPIPEAIREPGAWSGQIGGVLDMVNNPGKLANSLGGLAADAMGVAMEESKGLRAAAGEITEGLFSGLSGSNPDSPVGMERKVGTFNAFAAARIGMGGRDPGEETAKNTGRMVAQLKRIDGKIGQAATFA